MSTPSYTVGDKGIAIHGQCLDGTAATDLTGSTTELHIRKPDGTVLTRTATITEPTTGQWQYTWGAGELTEPNHWQIEAQVTSADGSIAQTFGPVTFFVKPEIG